MKKVLLALALCVSFSGMAQLVNVTSIDKVNIPENAASKVAAISPQGDYILMTTDYNYGLTKFDLATGATQVITRAQGAGHDAQISQDGSTVVYRERSTNKKHLQMKAMKTKNLATGAEQQLVKPSRDLQGVAIDGNTAVAVNKGKMSKKALDNGKAQVNTPVLSTNNFKLYITRNGKTTEFMPAGNHRYIWASMSPDATKALFYCSGKGAYVCNIDGSGLVSLGKLQAPKWMSNDMVVGMKTTDNGEVYTSGSIVVADLNGNSQTLTGDDVVAMYPLPASGKIAFSTPTGEAYIINLK
ncbi:MAG: hypothetical protein IJP59_01490 [Muribaculaceae bacterium]|nr:hypothetical protein [Muribaculaceae bacterium]